MAKRFGDLPKYAREHRASHRRGNSSVCEDISLLIHAILVSGVDPLLMAASLNPIVRMGHRGRGFYDCDYQSEAVISADDELLVEVEHGVEVAELIRHFIGNADFVHRETYRTPEEAMSNPDPTWDDVAEAVRSGDPERVAEMWERWGGVEWSGPPPDYFGDPAQIQSFMEQHYHRVLVSVDEHKSLGKATSGQTTSTLGTIGPVGGHLSRYRAAGIRVAEMKSMSATVSDLM